MSACCGQGSCRLQCGKASGGAWRPGSGPHTITSLSCWQRQSLFNSGFCISRKTETFMWRRQRMFKSIKSTTLQTGYLDIFCGEQASRWRFSWRYCTKTFDQFSFRTRNFKENNVHLKHCNFLGDELLERIPWRWGALLYKYCHSLTILLSLRSEWLRRKSNLLKKYLVDGISYLLQMLNFRCLIQLHKGVSFQDLDTAN